MISTITSSNLQHHYHVFVLREYMRECILGNFRRRLLGVLKTDNDLQRPSVLESLTRRHVSIVHLAEQHISMDIAQGIRQVLLSEAFLGPVSSLHLFEKPADQHTGSATESVCNWYIENIIKDVSGAGILDSWSETHRSHLVAQLIFLDQLCEISPYLPRSSLETHVPLEITNTSPRQSPALLAHASPVLRHPRGDSTPPYYGNNSGYFKGSSSSHSQEHLYDVDISSLRSTHRSGPLDYGDSQNKVKSVESSNSGITGPSPLTRFAVSRSGPLAYK